MPTNPNDLASRIQHNLSQVRSALREYSYVELGILFGSLAKGTETPESDVDVAVLASKPLNARQKIEIIEALALATGRPVDLIDLRSAGQPLLNQILKHGQRLLGSDEQMAALIYRNVVDRADFLPLRDRTLKEKRTAWISK